MCSAHNHQDSFNAGINSHDTQHVAETKLTAYQGWQTQAERLDQNRRIMNSLSYEDQRLLMKWKIGISLFLAGAVDCSYCIVQYSNERQ